MIKESIFKFEDVVFWEVVLVGDYFLKVVKKGEIVWILDL